MKNLILVVIMFLGLTVNSQTKETIEIPVSETERIIDKYGSKVAEGFSTFMDSATPMAKEGFEMVVKLQFAKGVAYLLIPIFCIIGWFIFSKNYKIAREDDPREWVFGKNGSIALASLIVSCCLLVASIPATYHGLLHVIAPEWYAIKELATLF